jgi:hypothetical protein
MRYTILTACLALVVFSVSSNAATIYTGDKIDGVPVISKLDVNDLPSGTIERFIFQGADNAIGQHEYVPVMVAKGKQPGPRLGLQAALHGDELNGTRTIQMVFGNLDVRKLKGVVIGAIGVNPTGMLASNRYYQEESWGGTKVDPNRIWPGKEHGDAANVHIWKLWNNLWGGNVDMVIDMHTQTSGVAYPLFVYADVRNQKVWDMAKLIPADQIKMDPGEVGSAETTFDAYKIPAITIEIGKSRSYEPDLINRSYTGVENVLVANGMVPGRIGETSKEAHSYWANDMSLINADVGGFAEVLVKLNQDVKKGTKLAVQRNAFGQVIKEYFAPVDGRVWTVATDPVREPGALLVGLLFVNPAPECKLGC